MTVVCVCILSGTPCTTQQLRLLTVESYVLTSWFEKYSPLLSELPSLFSDSWWTRLFGTSPLLHSELLCDRGVTFTRGSRANSDKSLFERSLLPSGIKNRIIQTRESFHVECIKLTTPHTLSDTIIH
jgi:hypothetical protein